MYSDRSLEFAGEIPEDGKTTKDNIDSTILRESTKIHIEDNNDNISEYLASILTKLSDHTVLIDVGAVLVGTTPQIIFNIVKRIRPQLQQFIYWNNKDYPIMKDKEGKELLWTGSIVDNMFYYYDNMHTTGIDAKIDSRAKGIVLLGSTSRYRDVSQGMYRMRKLRLPEGNRQEITFVINKNIKSSITNQELLQWFTQDENSYLTSQQRLMNMQNILALSRYRTINSPPIYKLKNEFSYPHAGSLTNLKIITGEESVRHNYVVSAKDTIIGKLDRSNNKINYQGITDINVERVSSAGSISMSIQQTIEQVKEIAQNYEKRQSKKLPGLSGDQYLISNTSISNYYNIRNSEYYDTYIEGIVYKSKNLKYYLSPYVITFSEGHFFVLPVVEGYKLFNTYIEKDFLEEFPRDVMFIDSNGVAYNKSDIVIQTLSLFLSHKIDQTIYISLVDYLNMFKVVGERNELVERVLEEVTNDKSDNDIYALFSKAILKYKNNIDECNAKIVEFNRLGVEERQQYYATLPLDIKNVFDFLTFNGNIVDKAIEF
jgi:hypothetical protein